MSSDAFAIAVLVVGLVAFVALFLGAIMVYEKKTRRGRRPDGSNNSTSNTMSDIINGM